MNQIFIILLIIILLKLLCVHQNENFRFESIPVEKNEESCKMRCENTAKCENYFYDDVTGQCVLTQYYNLGDIKFPFVKYGNVWLSGKYKFFPGRNTQK